VLAAESRSELPYHFGVNLVGDVVVGGRVVVRAGAVVRDVPAPAPVPLFARDVPPEYGGPR
jgi:hypothetical protein